MHWPCQQQRQITPSRCRDTEIGPQSIGKSCGGWRTKIHVILKSSRRALIVSLSGGATLRVSECHRKTPSGSRVSAAKPAILSAAGTIPATLEIFTLLGDDAVLDFKVSHFSSFAGSFLAFANAFVTKVLQSLRVVVHGIRNIDARRTRIQDVVRQRDLPAEVLIEAVDRTLTIRV